MSHPNRFDILLPFALPPAELASDLLRQLDAPSLAMLMARGRRRFESFDAFGRSLPHEIWLSRRLGTETRRETSGSPPAAVAAMRRFSQAPDSGIWFIVQPVHLHVARDHLVLTDPRRLPLTDEQSRRLFDDTAPLLSESGYELRYGDAHTWFLRADSWLALQTSTPDAACGHNIDIWMPKGDGDRAWRKLLNEIQMLWHAHPVNAGREMQRQEPVNSLWLWGGAAGGEPHAATLPYAAAFNLPAWAEILAAHAVGGDSVTADQAMGSAENGAVALLDDLSGPALAEDWGEWLARFQHLEKVWFTPILEAIKAGKMEAVSLILTQTDRMLTVSTSRGALRKFWINPSLHFLNAST